MENLKERATVLLQQCEVVVLTSVNEAGYPRPVPISKIHTEGFAEIWMATGYDSVKTRDFSVNPKAGLCFFEKGNSIAMTGTVEVITDLTTKERLWQDWFINHFPKGATDPNYVLLKFQGDCATIWIDGEFLHQKVKDWM